MKNLAIHEAHNQALKALQASPIKVLRDVQIARDGETLVLSGRVGSFYMKQMAQELVRSVVTDCEVCNSILVADDYRDA